MNGNPSHLAEPTGQSPAEESSGRGAFMLLCALITLSLYVFSTGPVLWAENRGIVPEKVRYAYFPLAMVTSHCPPVRHFLNWYVIDLWHGSISFD